MRKGFDQWLGTSFPKNIKSSEKHRPVTRNIKHSAAHTPNAAILNAEPMLHKVQWDLSLRKTFNLPFREGMRLQFQADAFNAFNRANWNNPNVSNAGSPTFGQITGSLPARVLQFGGKFNF
jgi:hypothetical protein